MVQAIPAQRISEDALFFNRIVAGLAYPVRAVVHLFECQIDLLGAGEPDVPGEQLRREHSGASCDGQEAEFGASFR